MLGDRIVPATYLWTDNDHTGLFEDPGNWQPAGIPSKDEVNIDSVVFSASNGLYANDDCKNLGPESGVLSQVKLSSDYTGTVTVGNGSNGTNTLEVDALDLEGGNLNQKYVYPDGTAQVTDIQVDRAFTWVGGGVLNNSDSLAGLTVAAGPNAEYDGPPHSPGAGFGPATATIDPLGGTLVTGDTIVIQGGPSDYGQSNAATAHTAATRTSRVTAMADPAPQGEPANATVQPGTVQFNNAASVVIGGVMAGLNASATMTINNGVSFTAPFPGAINVIPGGKLVIQGPTASTFASEQPLYVSGGLATIQGGVTANFTKVRGGAPADATTVDVNSGEIDLQNGCTLKALNLVSITGGLFKTLDNNGAAQATVATNKFLLYGGTLQIVGDGTLVCTRDAYWKNATLLISANGNAPATVSQWKVGGTLTVGDGVAVTLQGVFPLQVNTALPFITAITAINGAAPQTVGSDPNGPPGTYIITTTPTQWVLNRTK